MLLDARAGTETGKLASKRNGAPEPGRKCWNQSEEKMPPNEEASGKTVGDGGSLCRGGTSAGSSRPGTRFATASPATCTGQVQPL